MKCIGSVYRRTLTHLKASSTVYIMHNQPGTGILADVPPTTGTAALHITRAVVVGEAPIMTPEKVNGNWTQSGLSSTGIWYKTHRQQH